MSPKYIHPVALGNGRTVSTGNGAITNFRTKGPRCIGNGRVVWSLKGQSRKTGSVNTPRRTVYLLYRYIAKPPHQLPLAELSCPGGEKQIFPRHHWHGPLQTQPFQSKTGSLQSTSVWPFCWTELDWALSRTGTGQTGGPIESVYAKGEGSGIEQEWTGSG